MKQAIKLNCPVCDTPSTQDVETRLNTSQQPHLKKALLEGRLHQFECLNCGAKRHIESNFLYHDPTNKFMVFVIPGLKKKKDQIGQLLENISRDEKVDTSAYELRLVSRNAELIEKIQLFELNYNDREVEIVKLLTDGLFAKERPDDKVRARFFYVKDKQHKIMYLTEKDQLLVDFNQSLLDFARDKYKNVVSKPSKGEFHIIDTEWAAMALSN